MATNIFTVELNDCYQLLCGPNDNNISFIEQLIKVKLYVRGNSIYMDSQDQPSSPLFQDFFTLLEKHVLKNNHLDENIIKDTFNSLAYGNINAAFNLEENFISLPKSTKKIYARNRAQSEYMNSMATNSLTMALGPAGTGKTFLAVCRALFELLTGAKNKIIMVRPIVEAGENLGFLPGDFTQKISPYMRPLYDAINDLLDKRLLDKLDTNKQIEITPLAYMRGRNLNNSFIILDEGQNASKEQMKMFLTRIGENSKAVITGDPSQIDLLSTQKSSLKGVATMLLGLEGVGIHHFTVQNIIRSNLVKRILERYEQHKI